MKKSPFKERIKSSDEVVQMDEIFTDTLLNCLTCSHWHHYISGKYTVLKVMLGDLRISINLILRIYNSHHNLQNIW